MGKGGAPRWVKNAHPSRVWMGDGDGWGRWAILGAVTMFGKGVLAVREQLLDGRLHGRSPRPGLRFSDDGAGRQQQFVHVSPPGGALPLGGGPPRETGPAPNPS